MNENSNVYSNMQFKGPDATKIQCKDCIFREKDRLNGEIPGATLAVCECYPNLNKPLSILKGAECDYYQSEND